MKKALVEAKGSIEFVPSSVCLRFEKAKFIGWVGKDLKNEKGKEQKEKQERNREKEREKLSQSCY